MFTHYPVVTPKLKRIDQEGKPRLYETPVGTFPSVTSVLGAGHEHDLDEWVARVGKKEANKISTQARNRGTRLHQYCEDYLNNKEIKILNPFDVEMFKNIKRYLNLINDIRGLEISLYSKHLEVAGTADCIAVYKGKLSIIDYKTARKMKNKDWIHSYFLQTAAYAIMFEEITKTPITQLVILISNEEGQCQEFIEHRDNWTKALLEQRKVFKTLYLF